MTNSASGSCARAGEAGELDLGIERQQRRHAVGRRRGVADIAGERAGVLDLAAADLARRLLQPVEAAAAARRAISSAPGDAGADAEAVAGLLDVAERGQAGDVEDVFGERPPTRAG